MAWRADTIITWTCDLCWAETVTGDDEHPDGWVSDPVGHDRCPDCIQTPCGCDVGFCRVYGPTLRVVK